MSMSEQHKCQKQPFLALLASVVQFLAKASRFFAVFDRSVPDKAHLVAQNSSSGRFRANRQTNQSLTYTLCAC